MKSSFGSLAQSTVLGALLLAGGAACHAQNSGFSLDVHANSAATAKDIGLPIYPGATPWKEEGSDSAANLGFGVNGFHFGLLVASYGTADSPAHILDFYRKPLARYGEVLECYKGKPVGALTVTRSGLTCSATKTGEMQMNDKVDESTDHELRAGTPHHFRIVGISESKDGKTKIGLVYLELPKDSDAKD